MLDQVMTLGIKSDYDLNIMQQNCITGVMWSLRSSKSDPDSQRRKTGHRLHGDTVNTFAAAWPLYQKIP